MTITKELAQKARESIEFTVSDLTRLSEEVYKTDMLLGAYIADLASEAARLAHTVEYVKRSISEKERKGGLNG